MKPHTSGLFFAFRSPKCLNKLVFHMRESDWVTGMSVNLKYVNDLTCQKFILEKKNIVEVHKKCLIKKDDF